MVFKRMRILIASGIYPPDIGGPASFSRALAAELSRRGHQPSVVCYGGADTKTNEGWPVYVVPKKIIALLRYFFFAWHVFWRGRSSDIVFLQGPVSEGLPGVIGGLLACKPIVMKIVGDYAWESYRQVDASHTDLLDAFVHKKHFGKIGFIEIIERFTSKRATKIITPSKYLKNIVSVWGVASERIHVIYNTIPPLPKVDSREELRIRNRFSDKKIILMVARAVPWKHGDFLCEVLKHLPQDYLLVVVGDGPMLQRWQERASEIGVDARVLFVGKQDRYQVAEWFAMADVFALPSGYEGFPHVVAEAAMVGLPSFVSDKGGNPETKELFPELVSVLPYLDHRAWTEAFARLPTRQAPQVSMSFDELAELYLDVIKSL